jgi:ParB-like chromosome segregation protein Spo0J
MNASERPTSQWIDINRIVPHPDNPNKMSDDKYEKLKANVGESGRTPPLIVRSLEVSDQFGELHDAGKFQLLDGEHRLKVKRELGATSVECCVWAGVSDERAMMYLLTLNRLEGTDDKKKRAEIVRRLADLAEADELALMIPETADQIVSTSTEVTKQSVQDAQEAMDQVSRREALTVFCDPDDKAAINTAIKHWLDANDPERIITDCREGHALAAICRAYEDAHA